MSFSKQKRIEIYSKFNGKCAYCGTEIKLKDMQVDHIIPKDDFCVMNSEVKSRNPYIPPFLSHLSNKDCNHIDNLFPSCRVCNNWKGYSNLLVFKSSLEYQVKRLNQYSSSYRIAKKYGQIQEIIEPIRFFFENEP